MSNVNDSRYVSGVGVSSGVVLAVASGLVVNAFEIRFGWIGVGTLTVVAFGLALISSARVEARNSNLLLEVLKREYGAAGHPKISELQVHIQSNSRNPPSDIEERLHEIFIKGSDPPNRSFMDDIVKAFEFYAQRSGRAYKPDRRLLRREYQRWLNPEVSSFGRRVILTLPLLAGICTIMALVSPQWVAKPPQSGHHKESAALASAAPSVTGSSASAAVQARSCLGVVRATAGTPAALAKATSLDQLRSGWRIHRDVTGFCVAVPEAWGTPADSPYSTTSLQFGASPTRGARLVIDQTRQPAEDPLSDFEEKEKDRNTLNRCVNYKRISIERIEEYYVAKASGSSVLAPTADWQYECTMNGVRIHVHYRNFVTAKRRAYALIWSSPIVDERTDDIDRQYLFTTFIAAKD